jgi:hypothetical protein
MKRQRLHVVDLATNLIHLCENGSINTPGDQFRALCDGHQFVQGGALVTDEVTCEACKTAAARDQK